MLAKTLGIFSPTIQSELFQSEPGHGRVLKAKAPGISRIEDAILTLNVKQPTLLELIHKIELLIERFRLGPRTQSREIRQAPITRSHYGAAKYVSDCISVGVEQRCWICTICASYLRFGSESPADRRDPGGSPELLATPITLSIRPRNDHRKTSDVTHEDRLSTIAASKQKGAHAKNKNERRNTYTQNGRRAIRSNYRWQKHDRQYAQHHREVEHEQFRSHRHNALPFNDQLGHRLGVVAPH